MTMAAAASERELSSELKRGEKKCFAINTIFFFEIFSFWEFDKYDTTNKRQASDSDDSRHPALKKARVFGLSPWAKNPAFFWVFFSPSVITHTAPFFPAFLLLPIVFSPLPSKPTNLQPNPASKRHDRLTLATEQTRDPKPRNFLCVLWFVLGNRIRDLLIDFEAEEEQRGRRRAARFFACSIDRALWEHTTAAAARARRLTCPDGTATEEGRPATRWAPCRWGVVAACLHRPSPSRRPRCCCCPSRSPSTAERARARARELMGGVTSSSAGGGGGGETALGDLPESCVAEVLRRLDPPEICRMARLSRTFRGAASGDGVWEAKLPRNYARLLAVAADGEAAALEAIPKKEVYARLCRRNRLDGGTKVRALAATLFRCVLFKAQKSCSLRTFACLCSCELILVCNTTLCCDLVEIITPVINQKYKDLKWSYWLSYGL